MTLTLVGPVVSSVITVVPDSSGVVSSVVDVALVNPSLVDILVSYVVVGIIVELVVTASDIVDPEEVVS